MENETYPFLRNVGEPPEPPGLPNFLTLPFRDLDINIVQGWIYTWNPDPNAHKGIDYIKGSIYDPSSSWQSFNIFAAADGIAMHSSSLTYGKFVLIRHNEKDNSGNNYFTLYAHLDSVVSGIPIKDKYDTDYSSWKSVKRGEPIARAGTTGAPDRGIHLHFEVQRKAYANYKTDPYDLYTTRDSYPQVEAGCGPNYLWTMDPPERADGIVAEVHSPIELRVLDSQGRITGLLNGEEKNDIPDSAYFENSVTIFSLNDIYSYEIVGTNEGAYSLYVTFISGGQVTTFKAIDMATLHGVKHVYTVDWSALYAAEEGVVLEIDTNGDGDFERTIIADEDLTSEEFALQAETAIDFDPDVLNLRSPGNVVTAYIELPEGFDVSNIVISSLKLNSSVSSLSKPVKIDDYDEDGIVDLMVKFDRQQVIKLLGSGTQMVTLTGRLSDGRPLAGIDFIRVIDGTDAETAESENFITDIVENLQTADDESDDTDVEDVFDVKEGFTFMLFEASGIIKELSPESFNNEESAFELGCAIDDVFTMLDGGMYFESLILLENDILQRMDGCADIGEPDEDDWITSIEGQALLYPLLAETIQIMKSLL